MNPNGQPGDLWVLREIIHYFSEEARTRGFASLALASFAFVNNLTMRPKRKNVQPNTNDFDYHLNNQFVKAENNLFARKRIRRYALASFS